MLRTFIIILSTTTAIHVFYTNWIRMSLPYFSFVLKNSISSVQSISRVQLCDPMNHSMPGLPVHHQLPEFTQTHVHQVSDAIQPSHPLSSPFPPAPNPCQQQGLFQWVTLFTWGGQSTGVSALASVLPMNTQDWSPLEWTGWIFLQSEGFSRVFSNTTVQKYQFFSTQVSLWNISQPLKRTK